MRRGAIARARADGDERSARSWARHLVEGVREYFDGVDPLSADRALADAEDDGEGGLLGACARGDAALARDMLKDGNECVRWLMFGERRKTRDTAVHGEASEARRGEATRD